VLEEVCSLDVSKKKSRLFNEQTVRYFQTLLKHETLDTVYESACINETYSRFQGLFFKEIMKLAFLYSIKNYRSNHNNWFTKGIKISCTKKGELYSLYRNNKDNKDHTNDQHDESSPRLRQNKFAVFTIFPPRSVKWFQSIDVYFSSLMPPSYGGIHLVYFGYVIRSDPL